MNLDIEIVSRLKMFDLFNENVMKDRLVVSINDYPTEEKIMKCNYKKCISLKTFLFSDITVLDEDYDGKVVYPTKQHVKDILDFAGDKESVTVHCYAGVSRSSACAYLIAYNRCRNAYKAIQLLNHKYHHPNILLCQFGAELFNDQSILNVACSFIK